MKHNRTYLLLLIWLGIIEGISTLFLFFVAMPLKYVYEMPEAVSIAGMTHGFLFLGLVAMFIIAKAQSMISNAMMWGGIVGAILPFGPFVVDMKLYKLLQTKK